MKKRPIFIFATEADTGVNTLPIGSLIMVDDYATTGSKIFRKLNNTGLTSATTIAQAVTAKNITKAEYNSVIAMPANDVNMTLGELFTKTIAVATTLTLSNPPPAGVVGTFSLKLTNGGSATVTWPTGVKWASGTAPALTVVGVDELTFYTDDGGITYSGFFAKKDSK